MATVEQARAFAAGLPRSYEAVVRGRLKFRVGQIVYVAFSRDGARMGFGFPKEWRQSMIDGEPEKFLRPEPVDLKYNWLVVRLAAIDEAQLEELVLDAWSRAVPDRVWEEYAGANPPPS